MYIKVIRLNTNGDNVSPDTLVNELCTEISVGTELGKEHLYNKGFDKLVYDVSIPFRAAVKSSDLVAVIDSSIGESFVSRIQGFNITGSSDANGKMNIKQNLTLERSVL